MAGFDNFRIIEGIIKGDVFMKGEATWTQQEQMNPSFMGGGRG